MLSDDEWWAYGQQAHLFWNRGCAAALLRPRALAGSRREDAASLVRIWAKDRRGCSTASSMRSTSSIPGGQPALPLSLWTTLIDDTAPISLPDGLRMLIEALVERIGDVRYDQQVTQSRARRTVEVTVNGAMLDASDVVIATSTDVALDIYADASPSSASSSRSSTCPRSTSPSTSSGLVRPSRPGGHLRDLGPVDEMKAGDIIASVSLESGRLRRHTEGHQTLQIMLDAERSMGLLGHPVERVRDWAIEEAERKKLLPGLRAARCNDERSVRIPKALPRMPPGRFDVIRRYQQSISSSSRVKLAGTFAAFLALAALPSRVWQRRQRRSTREARVRPTARRCRSARRSGQGAGRAPPATSSDAVLGNQAALGAGASR